jgi:hypothetical protein
MSDTIDAVLKRIEAEQQTEVVTVADNASPLDFLTAIYRDPRQPVNRRMRAAIEAAPFIHPKLAVSANISGGEGIASRLELAIERSRARPKLIEAEKINAASLLSAQLQSDD